MVQPFVDFVVVQPSVEVLFRPEEIVHRSPTTLLDPNCFGIEMFYFTLIDDDTDLVTAMRA